jgi:DNA-binding CsgD family transcriptional regulator
MAGTVDSAHPAINPVLAAAQDHESLWESVERFGRIGTWGFTPETEELIWSQNLLRLAGFEPGGTVPTVDDLFERLHPDDLARMRGHLDDVLAGGGLPRLRFRLILADGSVRRLEAVQMLERHGARRDQRLLVGFARDLSHAVVAERASAQGAGEPLALTARELEVLRLAAEGLPAQEIRERLSVSQSTVKSHLEHIYEKLGVTNRVAAVARALREGLID